MIPNVEVRAVSHRTKIGISVWLASDMVRLGLFLGVCLGSPSVGAAGTVEWQSVSDDGFAQISARAVDGTSVQELRVSAVMKIPAERLIAVIGDVDHYPAFMPPTQEVLSLGREGNTGRWYIVIDPPLIHRRDYCVQITIDRLPGGVMQSRFHRWDQGCPPERPGLVRMHRVEGSWRLTPLADGTTQVVYQAITDPAGQVPTWMVNRAGGNSIRDMFRSLERAASNPSISACPGTSLGCKP